jgi:hypothetical protein
MATAAAAVVAKARRDIQHHFFAADAVRPDRAVAFTPSNRIETRQFAKLVDDKVIRKESGGLYWLDVVAYDIMLQNRYRRVRWALLALSLAVIVLIVMQGMRG